MTDLPAVRRRHVAWAGWWAGARPRTLTVGIVPVAVGAAASGHPTVVRTAGALVVGLALQIGANYANDYFDGVRGVDTERRVGPVRLVASGLAAPPAVLGAAIMSLGVAALAGLWLALAAGQPHLIVLGVLSVLAAVLYTGGPRPYAGFGIADLAVFLFFGLFATCGTAAVEVGHVPGAAWWAAVPVGLLAVAVLMANNLRDIVTDAAAGRRTLMVRIGMRAGRRLYQAVVIGALVIPLLGVALRGLPRDAAVVVLAAPLAVRPVRLVQAGAGRQLVPVLIATATLHLVVGVLLTGALAVATWAG